ncbi:MAG TPA: APC family permease, partial [Kofleriaceae bacterium]|nr:APC family permease [Kofleriaceae bacterium]
MAAADSTPRLLRVVGLAGLTAIALNGVVGSGIFRLPATVYGLVGAASPIAHVIAALVMALMVACFAEAGSRCEDTGGPYLYARAAFGELVGFVVGWMFFLTRLAATAAIANVFVDYLGAIAPVLGSGAGRFAAITAAVGGLAVLNVFGVRGASRAVNLLTIAKLVPLALFVGVGLWFVDPARIALAVPDLGSLRQAALLLVFAYGGFENANVPTEEAIDPRRHLPVALLVTIGAVAVLYVLIQVVAQGTLPGLATSATPLADAARAVLGAPGGWMLTAAAIVSTLGSISAVILVGPRILFAFARHGQLPAALARIHPRYRSPHWAVAVFAVLTWAVALSGGFAELAALSAVARLVFSATTCLAVPVLRRQQGALAAGFVLPGGPAIPLIAVGLSVWLLTGVTRAQATAGGLGLASALVVYGLQRWLGAR